VPTSQSCFFLNTMEHTHAYTHTIYIYIYIYMYMYMYMYILYYNIYANITVPDPSVRLRTARLYVNHQVGHNVGYQRSIREEEP